MELVIGPPAASMLWLWVLYQFTIQPNRGPTVAHKGAIYAMATEDPFSLAFDALWAVLENAPAFASAIPSNNRIKYNTNARQPERARGVEAAELPADRPLVRIQPNGGLDFIPSGISSNSTKLVKKYQILVALGDLRVNMWLHPLEFIIIGALENYQATTSTVVWNGPVTQDQFIKNMRVSDVPEGKNQADAVKNISTWAAIFNVSLEMWFTRVNIINLPAQFISFGQYQPGA